MKIKRDNPFANRIARVQKWLSGISFDTTLGRIKDFFFEYEEEYELDYEYDYDYDYEEATPAIYHLPVYDVSEYEFVLTLLKEGYTVITDMARLTDDDKDIFRRKLQIALFQYGISCHKVSNNCFVVAPKSVEIIKFDEPEQKQAKIMYLADYRKK